MRIYELIEKCKEKGIRFASLYEHLGKFVVTAHDAKRAGRKPNINEMRDAVDFQFAMDGWSRKGLIILGADADPIKAIEVSIDYLDNL